MAKWDVDKATCQKCKERSSEAADWRSQSDEVQAAVAAALREAALIARASFDGEIGYDEILDLITPDSQAALDRYVKQITRSERSE